MPRRNDLHSILVIGSGPIVIGQACEFDYSGTQACRVLVEEGYRVILANSNPATIMTDPAFAHRTYVEPLTVEVLEAIIARERPDAVLPTLGGQTALNLAVSLHERGTFQRFGVEMIGASATAIATAEDRERFKEAMTEIGLAVPECGFAYTLGEAVEVAGRIGYPLIVRPSYILGGAGTGLALDAEELARIATAGLAASPISEILIERSIAGWKEYELEVMRDRADNCVVICSIENFDPMGVHTGDSITVAPAQTLSDHEYQRMRDAAFACIRRIGVETGGSNIQFAVDPSSGDQVVIEMNPRVSRSSALASKATGFPIAKIAARLAVGYTLDEITNDITGKTPACFEPAIDYVVTKIPRWAFEKFPGIPDVLGTRMQSVGEAMAIGRTFIESLQKGLRSLERGRLGLNCDPPEAIYASGTMTSWSAGRRSPLPTGRSISKPPYGAASRSSASRATGVDPWFLDQIELVVEERRRLAGFDGPGTLDRADWRAAKRLGFSDAQLAWLWSVSESEVRQARLTAGVCATMKTVDTCAAEFEAHTPYHYSTYEDDDEVAPSERPKIIILGSGPNRIGQGVEFDYCCVQASFALHDAGFETVMINCNPETVSTDYDTSDRLYFEPVTWEDVSNVIDVESATGTVAGVIVSLGGQTPLKLAGALPPGLILGTSPESIDLAEDRERWNALCGRLEIPQPRRRHCPRLRGSPGHRGTGRLSGPGAPELCARRAGHGDRVQRGGPAPGHGRTGRVRVAGPRGRPFRRAPGAGRPVPRRRHRSGRRCRPGRGRRSPDRGGNGACRGSRRAFRRQRLRDPTADARSGHDRGHRASHPRHCRRPGSGRTAQRAVRRQGTRGPGWRFPRPRRRQGHAGVRDRSQPAGQPHGSVCVQSHRSALCQGWRPGDGRRPSRASFGPRASLSRPCPEATSASKRLCFPFARFPDADTLLGPEMRSTGEVMGIDTGFGLAFAKSQAAAGDELPAGGTVFFSLADRDKAAGVAVARRFVQLGFRVAATAGTASYFGSEGVPVDTLVAKLGAVTDNPDPGPAGQGKSMPAAEIPGGVGSDAQGGEGVDAVALIRDGKVDLVVNTPRGRGPRADGAYIRRAANQHRVACLTTVAAARAAAAGIAERAASPLEVRSLQEYHQSEQLPLS